MHTQIQNFKEKLKIIEHQKDSEILNMQLSKENQTKFENFREEFQRRENLLSLQNLQLKFQLDKTEEIINQISVDREEKYIKIEKLENALQAAKRNIEEVIKIVQ